MSREQISAMMDGELDNARAREVCAQMKLAENMDCWAAYHLIGDALRSECVAQKGFSRRFAERLAAEPTILAPGVRGLDPVSVAGIRSWMTGRRVQYALAASAMVAAVGLVGWFGLQEFTLGPGLNQMASSSTTLSTASGPASGATARMGSTVSAGSVQASRRSGGLGLSPYLLVHQEYSPTTAMQGVRPYIRTVADMTVE
jgi:sigma-E factor negative regulatory protein RseA